MKSILSFAIGLIALFTVTTGFTPVIKANPHFVSGPCLDGRTIKGTVAGLGSGPITATADGKFVCVNRGGNTPAPKSFTITQTFNKTSGGNFKLALNVASLCPNRNFTFRISDVTITVCNAAGECAEETFSGALPTCR